MIVYANTSAALVLALFLTAGCLTGTPAASTEPLGARTWTERAERAQEQLHEKFWDDEQSLFRIRYPESDSDQWHYWWQAHALDTLVDAYERTDDERYLRRADRLYRGVVERNNGITIDYYDDMLWMALALLRLHDHTGDGAHRDAVFVLWKDIQTGWNDHYGGGIAWRKSQLDYKNTPANAPAVILAARLHQRFGNASDLHWAKRIYDWLQETLIDPETGFAWDGINRQGDGRADKSWAFTYNQGVYMGASLELYRATGEDAYRQEALRTAKTTAQRFVNDRGIIKERGSGDGGLFKGILVHYLTELILECPEDTTSYRELLLHNAETLWSRTVAGDHMLFAANWSRSGEPPLDLSVQLSGMKLVEKAARLSRRR